MNLRLNEILSYYPFLTYSLDQEQGEVPFASLCPTDMDDYSAYAQLEDWYRKKQILVREISQNYHVPDIALLTHLCNRLERIFDKNVLRNILPHVSDSSLSVIEANRLLLAQTNLAPRILQIAFGKIDEINPFLFHHVLEKPNYVKEIDLTQSHYLTDDDLTKICQSFPYIQKLDLKGCYYLTKGSLSSLSQLAYLETLMLPPGIFNSLTPEEIGLNPLAGLKYIGFGDHTGLIPMVFQWINALPSIQILDLSSMNFKTQSLEILTNHLALLILDNHDFIEKSSLIQTLGKLDVHTISLQQTNMDKQDILRLIALSIDPKNPNKRQKLENGDSVVPTQKSLQAILLDHDRFNDLAFITECHSFDVNIETGDPLDELQDSLLGSSLEDGGSYFAEEGSSSPIFGTASDEDGLQTADAFSKRTEIY